VAAQEPQHEIPGPGRQKEDVELHARDGNAKPCQGWSQTGPKVILLV
jgi:hypothetical protein